jgi:hypothetical protein
VHYISVPDDALYVGMCANYIFGTLKLDRSYNAAWSLNFRISNREEGEESMERGIKM